MIPSRAVHGSSPKARTLLQLMAGRGVLTALTIGACAPQSQTIETPESDVLMHPRTTSPRTSPGLDERVVAIASPTGTIPAIASAIAAVRDTGPQGSTAAPPTTVIVPVPPSSPATPTSSTAPPGNWREQWRAALQLYKRHDYEHACPLFRVAAQARGINGSLWGDLGLCELRWGHNDASVYSTLLAIRYGDDRVRMAAYHNLALASFKVQLPIDGCTSIPSTNAGHCTTPVYSCVRQWRGSGTLYRGFGSFAAFSVKEDSVREWYEQTPDWDLDEDDARASAIELSHGQEADCDIWCANHPEFAGEGCLETCLRGSGHDEPRLSCDVVFVDACSQRVGYVCWSIPVPKTYEPQPRHGLSPQAFEYQIPSNQD